MFNYIGVGALVGGVWILLVRSVCGCMVLCGGVFCDQSGCCMLACGVS